MAIKKDEKKGTWYAYGSYRDSLGKKHQYKKRGFKTKKDANKFDVLYKEQLKNPSSTMTLSKLFDIYLEYAKTGLKDSTYRRVLTEQKWWVEKVGDIPIAKINSYSLQHVIDMSLKKVRVKTMRQKLCTLKTAFDYAVKRNLASENPATKIVFPKEISSDGGNIQFWTEEQFSKFISVVTDVTDSLIYNMLYMMGLRVNEAMCLQWKDIDLDNKRMSISKTTNQVARKQEQWFTSPKTKHSTRNISIPEALAIQLKDYKERLKPEEDWCVFGIDKPMSDHTVRYRFYSYIQIANKRLSEEQQIPKIRLHGLRHSHASYLINNMVSEVNGKRIQTFTPYDIANRLGDDVNTLLSTYAHWFDANDSAITNMMDTLMDTNNSI